MRAIKFEVVFKEPVTCRKNNFYPLAIGAGLNLITLDKPCGLDSLEVFAELLLHPRGILLCLKPAQPFRTNVLVIFFVGEHAACFVGTVDIREMKKHSLVEYHADRLKRV